LTDPMLPDEKQKLLMGDHEYVNKVLDEKKRDWMNEMN